MGGLLHLVTVEGTRRGVHPLSHVSLYQTQESTQCTSHDIYSVMVSMHRLKFLWNSGISGDTEMDQEGLVG